MTDGSDIKENDSVYAWDLNSSKTIKGIYKYSKNEFMHEVDVKDDFIYAFPNIFMFVSRKEPDSDMMKKSKLDFHSRLAIGKKYHHVCAVDNENDVYKKVMFSGVCEEVEVLEDDILYILRNSDSKEIKKISCYDLDTDKEPVFITLLKHSNRISIYNSMVGDEYESTMELFMCVYEKIMMDLFTIERKCYRYLKGDRGEDVYYTEKISPEIQYLLKTNNSAVIDDILRFPKGWYGYSNENTVCYYEPRPLKEYPKNILLPVEFDLIYKPKEK